MYICGTDSVETEIDACRAEKIYELNGSKLNVGSEIGNTVPLKESGLSPCFLPAKCKQGPFARGA